MFNIDINKLIKDIEVLQHQLIINIKTKIDNFLPEKEEYLYKYLFSKLLISNEQYIQKNVFNNEISYQSFLKNFSYFIINRLLFAKIVNDKKRETFNLNLHNIYDIIAQPPLCFINDEMKKEIDVSLYPDEESLESVINKFSNYNFKKFDSESLSYLYEYFLLLDDKKRLGAYYTDPWIVQYIVSELNINKDSVVLEPSCGTGAFLCYTYDYLKNMKLTHNKILKQLYGVDINHLSIEICIMRMFLKNIKQTDNMTNMHFYVFNTLRDIKEQIDLVSQNHPSINKIPESFDAILGNPPYGLRFDKKDKSYLSKKFKDSWFMKYDSFACFLQYGIDKLKESGRLGFIIPSTLLSIDTFQFLRKYILNSCKIVSITDLGKSVFAEATVSTIVLVLEKCSDQSLRESNNIKFVNLSIFSNKEDKQANLYNKEFISHVSQHQLYTDNDKYQFLFKNSLHKYISEKTLPLKLICDIKIAARSTEFTTDITNGNLTFSSNSEMNNSKPLLKGRNNKKWHIDLVNHYTKLYISENDIPKIKQGIYEKDKVIISHTQGNNVVASLDNQKYPWTGDVFIVTLLKDDNMFLLEYILAVINSDFMQELHQNLYRETTPHFIKTAVENLPIPHAEFDEQLEIKELVHNIINHNDKEKNLSLLNDKIKSIFSRL